MKEPFIIYPLRSLEGIGERINKGYGLMLPYPFSGLEMPPEVRICYLLGGKESTESKEKREKE
ncbi:MAG: hypothetical protein MUO24_10750 [Desulfobacterales bacterium]|nr:hypothetical protein [Desulfobacterales bacterium]